LPWPPLLVVLRPRRYRFCSMTTTLPLKLLLRCPCLDLSCGRIDLVAACVHKSSTQLRGDLELRCDRHRLQACGGPYRPDLELGQPCYYICLGADRPGPGGRASFMPSQVRRDHSGCRCKGYRRRGRRDHSSHLSLLQRRRGRAGDRRDTAAAPACDKID
jgi:hypothetical protein